MLAKKFTKVSFGNRDFLPIIPSYINYKRQKIEFVGMEKIETRKIYGKNLKFQQDVFFVLKKPEFHFVKVHYQSMIFSIELSIKETN